MKAEIIAGNNGRGSIRLDGQDVSNAVRGFTLTAGVGRVAALELDLVLTGGAEVQFEDVVIKPQSRDLLIALGWTPPGGADGP